MLRGKGDDRRQCIDFRPIVLSATEIYRERRHTHDSSGCIVNRLLVGDEPTALTISVGDELEGIAHGMTGDHN